MASPTMWRSGHLSSESLNICLNQGRIDIGWCWIQKLKDCTNLENWGWLAPKKFASVVMWVQPISQITSFHVWQANASSQNTSRHGHMIHSPSGHSTSVNTLLDIPMMICHDLPIDSAEQAGQFQGLDCVCFGFSGSSSSSSLADAIT